MTVRKKTDLKFQCSSGHGRLTWIIPATYPKNAIEAAKICACGKLGKPVKERKRVSRRAGIRN